MTRRSCFISFPYHNLTILRRALTHQVLTSAARATHRSDHQAAVQRAAQSTCLLLDRPLPLRRAGDGRESSQQGRCCRHVGTTRASISGGSVCLKRISASISGASSGFRCRAEGQRREAPDRGVAPPRPSGRRRCCWRRTPTVRELPPASVVRDACGDPRRSTSRWRRFCRTRRAQRRTGAGSAA
jgi:hypothetical protein